MNLKILLILFLFVYQYEFVSAASWSDPGTDPLTITDKIVDSTQDTKLNNVSWWGSTPIYTTLQSVSNNVEPYIDWWLYIWLAVATILLIYNGLMLVFSPITNKATDVKKRIENIIIGIIVLTGFYLIIRLLVSVISSVTPW